MTETMFRTLEKLQRTDSLLRLAQERQARDVAEIAFLRNLKRKIRSRLSRGLPLMASA